MLTVTITNTIMSKTVNGGGIPPSNTVAPVISGSSVIGSTLTSTTGTWIGTPVITYAYQWKRAGVNIIGATNSTYVLVSADYNQAITCEVTATNAFGSVSALSNSITGTATAPVNTVAPVISGSTTIGSTLSSTTGTWTGTAPITYTYQWKRNGSDIPSATSSTYVLVTADATTNITCQVTATNIAGSANATSNTLAIPSVAPVNTVAPVISGTNVVGSTLSSTTGTWTGAPTPTYTYQWKRGASNIGGATSSTYTLVQADATFSITCVVTATNAAGSANATSNALTIIDADAQAFFTASGLTGTTNQSAINQLVVDMKGYGIWTKMKAIYPMIGGTAALHKWNLKDPQDTDAAFRLSFNGGWTHSATGAQPNGINGYAETYINVNSVLSNISHAFNFYLNSNNDATIRGTLGAYISSSNSLDSYNFNSGVYYRSGSSPSNIGAPTNNGKGFFGLTRRNSNNFDMLKQDGTYITSPTISTYTGINRNIWLGRINPSGVGDYAIQSQAYVSISEGLTQAEMTSLRTAVITFETTLGRNA